MGNRLVDAPVCAIDRTERQVPARMVERQFLRPAKFGKRSLKRIALRPW
jgi:hypothetical protein